MKRIMLSALAVLSMASMAVLAEEPARQMSKMPPGYIAAENLPDSSALVPPAPAANSATEKRDKAASKAALAAHGTPRWTVATNDADLFTAGATSALSCAAGFEISPQTTPALDRLLRRSMIDFGLAAGKAKRRYNRVRPFKVNKQPMCTPDQAGVLAADGSYPSGHSAIGFGWGMLLSQLLPEQTTRLMARARAFGESRRYCNAHWQSDVEEGRVVAAAVFARLQSEPAYLTDLQSAREELAHMPRPAPARDCAAEAAALAQPGR